MTFNPDLEMVHGRSHRAGPMEDNMFWDYATGTEYVRIEAVQDGEMVHLITEIPLSCPDAEPIAETICNKHNAENAPCPS